MTCGGDGTRCCEENVTQQLRFGNTRVSDEEDVDISTKPSAVGQDFFKTAEQHAEEGSFDVLVTMDGWRQRFAQQMEYVYRLHPRELLTLAYVVTCDIDRRFFA